MIEISKDAVLVYEDEVLEYELPHLWIRDNCSCDACRVKETQEKQFILSSVELNITPTNVTETILIPAGVDASRDNQGFLMNRQKDTNSLNLARTDSDLSSMPFMNSNPVMKYNLECSLEELYHGTQKEFSIQHTTKGDKIKNTKYVINVKKGSKNDDNIVVKEGGNYIPELNLTEDLVIQIVEKEHPRYRRKDNDLYIIENITLIYINNDKQNIKFYFYFI